jgi:hypothetical protein
MSGEFPRITLQQRTGIFRELVSMWCRKKGERTTPHLKKDSLLVVALSDIHFYYFGMLIENTRCEFMCARVWFLRVELH